MGIKMVSARSVKLPRNAKALDDEWASLEANMENMGVHNFTLNKPSIVISQCAMAVKKGLPVVSMLSRAAMLSLLENKKGSLGATLSGVRSWIACTITVLGYDMEAALPPVSTVHVMMWLQCCRSPCAVVQCADGLFPKRIEKEAPGNRRVSAGMQGVTELEDVDTAGGLLRCSRPGGFVRLVPDVLVLTSSSAVGRRAIVGRS